jgi:signal transduction histidine kinase
MNAWAEMLSRVGQKNSRLYDFVAHDLAALTGTQTHPDQDAPVSGRLMLEELERERSRIARELHAGAGQPLAGIKLNLEMLTGCADALPTAGREALGRLQTLAEQALAQVRAVSHKLHPPDWQGLNVEDAIRNLLRTSGLEASVRLDLNIEDLPAQPAHAVKIALYRCAQECISNVLRHACATELRVSLTSRSGTVELRVEDNGKGLPAAAPPASTPRSGGIGLKALQEHAAALGGVCEVSSGSTGVVVTVRLPLEVE